MSSKFNFEKSIEKLEAIVASLEDRTISLEESLKLYENGISLINSCNAALEEARQRIKVLSAVTSDMAEEDENDK